MVQLLGTIIPFVIETMIDANVMRLGTGLETLTLMITRTAPLTGLISIGDSTLVGVAKRK
jgi:hypothetical protein